MPSLHKLRIIGFKALQSVGFHIVPNHFYEPVPDTRKLPESTWTKPSSLAGIDMKESSQLKLLAALCGQFGAEFGNIPTSSQFGSVDLEILYSMVRQLRPRVVLEVGSGTSTQVSASALIKNGCGELVAVEPYPNETIKKGFPGLTRLIAAPVQQVELSEFECLGKNDILFIDSSHMLKIGSDVQFLFLEVLPRLKTGVVVHIHDIFLPANYPRHWVVDDLRFWNEQYILQAFLAFNRAFEVLWAGSYMNMNYPERLESVFPSYRRGQTSPGSFWMQKIC
jgi:predicted O-methyltransferase YrrM